MDDEVNEHRVLLERHKMPLWYYYNSIIMQLLGYVNYVVYTTDLYVISQTLQSSNHDNCQSLCVGNYHSNYQMEMNEKFENISAVNYPNVFLIKYESPCTTLCPSLYLFSHIIVKST